MQTEYELEQKVKVIEEVSALTGMLSALENARKHIENLEAQVNEKNDKSFWVARVGDSLLFGTYPTKQECQRAHPHADGYHEITYEEKA